MRESVYTLTGCYNCRVKELFNGHGWVITEETAPLPDGRIATRTRASFSDTVHILAFDADGKLLILREFRPFYGEYIWMLPSGHVDKETDPLVAAKRELREETGFAAASMKFLWSARSSEKFKNQHLFYLASGLTENPLPQDNDELIEVHHFPLEEALEKILASPMVHMSSGYAVLRYVHECMPNDRRAP